MNKITKSIISFILIAILALAIALAVSSFLKYNSIQPDKFGELLTEGSTLGIAAILLLLYFLLNLNKIGKGSKDDSTSSSGKGGTKQYFDSKFLTEKELNKKFVYATWNDLPHTKDGVVIRAELRKGTLHVNLQKPIHTLVIGTTGSGKTTMYVDPSLQILSHCKTKPSLVVTDPKGELYANHAYNLKQQGYDVKVLNLRDVFSTTRWNPLDRAYTFYERSMNLQKEVKVHHNDKPQNFKLKMIEKIYPDVWYEFNGTAYPSKESVMNDLIAKKKELYFAAQEDLIDIAKTLSPIENQNDPSWDQGSQNYIMGVLFAMLEDIGKPELGMTREKFNLYNMSKIATFRDNDPDDQFKTVKKYLLEGRDPMSTVPQLCGPLLNNAPTTTRSYLGMVSTKLSMLSDMGICYATSANDMAFETFCDKPTAFFIIVPDEKQTRHQIATMAIVQLYKTLIDRANQSSDRVLPRNIYFMLDEFGNLPKISTLDNIITVGRSRGIFMILIVQSYTQLNNVYGDKIADIVRTNCNIQVFIGTTDAKTKEEFSKMCGQITVKTTSISKGEKDSKSKTTSEAVRPLIYPEELELLPKNTVIVKMYHENPTKVVFTPMYAEGIRKFYTFKPMQEEYRPAQQLDEKAVFYDMAERNKKVLGDDTDGFDDFGF